MPTRSLLLLGAISFLASACARPDDGAATAESASGVAAASAATDAGAVRQAIEAANAKFINAFKSSDTVAIAENYAEDAIVMAPNTEAWKGREAIRRGFAGMLGQVAVKEFTMTTEDVAVAGDLAVETGSYAETAQPRGGQEIKDKGKYLVVWKRQADGSWKILRDAFSSDAPPPRS